MKTSLVSIVMISYNHAPYLKESIESVISQTYTNWELIVIDDGSQDTSLDIVNDYIQRLPNKIRLYTHPNRVNLGISASYKLGLRFCQGEFIGFLEGDDVWSNINLERKINVFLINQNVGLVYSNVEPIGDSEIISLKQSYLKSILFVPSRIPFDTFASSLYINFIPSFSTAVVKRKLLQNLQYIENKKYEICLDWFLWIQLSLKTKFFFIPEKLIKWRLYKKSNFHRFLLKQGSINIKIFEIKYRLMLFREIILSQRVNIWKKFTMSYLFSIGFTKRIFFYIKDKIIQALCKI